MRGTVLTGASFHLKPGHAKPHNGEARRRCGSLRSRRLLNSILVSRKTKRLRRTQMTKNTTTNNYRIPADQLQNLEIDRNGRVAPRLHDLEPLKNTLLSALYPGIKVASVTVPT